MARKWAAYPEDAIPAGWWLVGGSLFGIATYALIGLAIANAVGWI